MTGLLPAFGGIAIAVAAFAVLLPLIVFVHEYGHFKVARLCGVRVDAFSIGFGPALVGWTDRHGTRWKISAIPLGGYVKFFGDANAASAGIDVGTDLAPAEAEPAQGPGSTQFGSERAKLEAVLTDDEKRVCFHFKPVWQRMAVVAAGPFANFVLAAVIFAGIFAFLGKPYNEPVIGTVADGSPAAEAGLMPGDRVLTVGGRQADSFEEIENRIRLSSDTALAFEVDRAGETLQITAYPRREAQRDAFGNEVEIGSLGIAAAIPASVGLVAEGSPAEAAGIEAGDRIAALNGEPVESFAALAQRVAPLAGETVLLTIIRDGVSIEKTVTVGAVEVEAADGGTEIIGRIGVGVGEVARRRFGPIGAMGEGILEVGRTLEMTVTYLGRIITGREDIRELGGPVKIGQYAGQAAKSGFIAPASPELTFARRALISFTQFMLLAALMSVSIGFLNLLPVPVLDGGHLVFYGYEAIAGRPLPERVQGAGFTIGLFMVGGLMVFVVINDVMGLL